MTWLVLVASLVSANPDCGFPSVSRTKYRPVPEEADVALVALSSLFVSHPPRPDEELCVTTPGYKAPEPQLRHRLNALSLRLDANDNCRFREGQIVYSATGVWRTDATHFVADVSKLHFSDISTTLELYRYTIVRSDKGLSVEAQAASPCNP
jgi:prophage tail gpP-like protein